MHKDQLHLTYKKPPTLPLKPSINNTSSNFTLLDYLPTASHLTTVNMQFTVSLTTLFAATALALPGTPVQERQAAPSALVRFWNSPQGNTCNTGLAGSMVFVQGDDSPCISPINIPNPYKTFNVTGNTLTRVCKSFHIAVPSTLHTKQSIVRLYSEPGCNPTIGNHFDVPARQDIICSTQQVRSAKICPVGGCPDN